MANTDRSVITAEVDAVYQKTLLLRVVANFPYTKWAQIANIQQGAGTNTVRFRRYGNLTAATTALTEGVTPSGSQLSITNITASTSQYGDYVTFTDKVEMETQDPLLTVNSEILGDQAADTFDQLTRDVLAAGTSVFYANGVGGRGSVAANVALADYRKIARAMRKNKARKITKMITGSDQVGTTPVRASYVALVSPDTHYDLKGLESSGFIPVHKYPSSMTLLDENEIGSLDEFRFVETPNGKIFAGAGSGSVDVHADVILADQAYGISRINGHSMEMIYKPLGSAGTADPLNQRQTQGWKATFVAYRLNESFMYRYEHAVTA
jgi:N4-gp56 family major capsid protein